MIKHCKPCDDYVFDDSEFCKTCGSKLVSEGLNIISCRTELTFAESDNEIVAMALHNKGIHGQTRNIIEANDFLKARFLCTINCKVVINFKECSVEVTKVEGKALRDPRNVTGPSQLSY